jgi:1-deoxy-D-xylulose-5-phosphate reductoisomerase
MNNRLINVAIFGSTGSIGRNAIEVAEASCGRIRVVAISAHSNLQEAVLLARRLEPRWLIATDPEEADSFDWGPLSRATELVVGTEGLERVAADPAVDVVVSAIVGSAGVRGTWAALGAGKRVALANKETMVVAGPLVMELAKARGAVVMPVDSEHSAIFQSLLAGKASEVRRIILTASGGPFREHSRQQLEQVTVAEALAHPTWDMGPKITIDSATMMNKALEIIEARWLFDFSPDQIEVVIHPQSIVHSMVQFVDGSVVAQLGPPDMKLPIQYALTYPERWSSPAASLNWDKCWHLEFQPADLDRFPALKLGYEVARAGGTAGAVLSAANEAAVGEFLEGQLRFTEIVPACRSVLEHHEFDPQPTLERLLELDRWARQEVSKWICA